MMKKANQFKKCLFNIESINDNLLLFKRNKAHIKTVMKDIFCFPTIILKSIITLIKIIEYYQ